MESLLWLDPAHWLNEISRLARGELPYRDYSYQYPPFAIFLYGWLLRAFGISFTTVQVITDIVDIAAVACCWTLIRRLLPPALHLACGAFLVAVCATSLMNFNLFSYVTYSPSLQIAAAGILLLLFAVLQYLRAGSLGPGGWALAASGGFIAVMGKPESALASLCLIVLLALITRKPLDALVLWAVAFVPAIAGYLLVGVAVGFSNLRAGVTGYGLATAYCPWWPTGLSLFGVLAFAGEAAAVAALLSLPKARQFTLQYGRYYRALLVAAVVGVALRIAYAVYQNVDALTAPGLSVVRRASLILPSLLYTNAILEPVLWTTIAVFLVLAWRVLVRRRNNPGELELLLILTVPVVMCSRSLFTTTQSYYPEVAAICYPFLLILGPYFLWKFLQPAAGPRYAAGVVIALTVGYALIRVGGGWPALLSNSHYGTLNTEAGTVKLLNYDVDARIYSYVMAHTSPEDYVLDIPYGGGINFASGRRYPIFNVQLFGLGVPAKYEKLDLDLVQARPPRLVIGQDDDQFGTYWGFGNKDNRACSFPHLVWKPEGLAWDPNHVLAVTRYIQEHYRIAEKIGKKVILVPK